MCYFPNLCDRLTYKELGPAAAFAASSIINGIQPTFFFYLFVCLL